MRSLHPDHVYFDYLDSICGKCQGHPHLAAMWLAVEFPVLRVEEARAVCCDWQKGNAGSRFQKRHGEKRRPGQPPSIDGEDGGAEGGC